MNEKISYHVFETRLGWVACLGSSKGLRKVSLPCESRESALQGLGKEAGGAEHSPQAFVAVEQELRKYYGGQKPDFSSVPLDFSEATPFRRKIWGAIQSVPYGETKSYAWIAKQAGKPGAARAAGQAVGDNPFAVVVPCHRVIASDGGLCGFGGGLEMKRKLLALEANRGAD